MMESTDVITQAAIKKWAYKKNSQKLPHKLEEVETVVEHGDLLLSLVVDQTCPQRAAIVDCFYSLVGRSASMHIQKDIDLINILLTKAALYTDPVIINWVTRSKVILRDLRKYDYAEWCGGGFTRKDLGIVNPS
jgi:hypothetical protein